MSLKIINIKKDGLNAAVTVSIETLRLGGIIAYPTDTLYGLGVDAENKEAFNKIHALKGSPKGKPISVMYAGLHALQNDFGTLTGSAKRLADAFLPGAVTLVLNKPTGSRIVGGATVGIRIPDNKYCERVLKSYRRPVTTTSVNPTEMPPARSADEIEEYFGDKVDLIVDGGTLPESKGSTVIDLTGEEVKILREGALSYKQIMEVAHGG